MGLITLGQTLTGKVGVAFSQTPAFTGTISSWALESGSGLPSGLALNGASGLISGTPTTKGSSNAVFSTPLARFIAIDGNIALREDGTVFTWASGAWGDSIIPPELSSVTAISSGWEAGYAGAPAGVHFLALKSNGTVVAWGRNTYGQASVPAGLLSVTAVAAGAEHSLALKSNGTVVAWGRNNAGQVSVPSGLSGVIAVSAAANASYALKSDGTVVGWGGHGAGVVLSNDGVALSNIVKINAGFSHLLAIKTDGTVVASGYDDYGQSSVPVGLSNVIEVYGNRTTSFAIKSDGTVVYWGRDGGGGMSSGVVTLSSGGVLSGIVAMGCNLGAVVALDSDGFISSGHDTGPAGAIRFGQIENFFPYTTTASIAFTITEGVPIITAGQTASGTVGTAFTKTFSLTDSTNRPVTSWGATGLPDWATLNTITGAITGTPQDSGSATITLTATGPGGTDTETATIVTKIGFAGDFDFAGSASASASLNLSQFFTASFLLGWDLEAGVGGVGILGSENFPADFYKECIMQANLQFSASLQLVLPSVSFSAYGQLSPGSMGLVKEYPLAPYFTGRGSLQVRVDGYSGILSFPSSAVNANYIYSLYNGVLTRYVRSTGLLDATFVPLYGVKDFSIGSQDSNMGLIVLREDGTVSALGSAYQVPIGLSDVVSIAAGRTHALAAKANGTVVQWGSPAPTLPLALAGVKSVCAGNGYSIALKSNGTVVQWGGTGGSGAASVTDVVAIATRTVNSSSSNSFALRSDGSVKAWPSSTAWSAVLPASDIIGIAAGSDYLVALKADGSAVAFRQISTAVRSWDLIPKGYNHSFVSVREGCLTRSDGSQFLVYGSAAINIPVDLKVPLVVGDTRPSRVYTGASFDLSEAAEVRFGPAVPWDATAEAVSPNGLAAEKNVGQYALRTNDYSYSIEDAVLTITPGVPYIVPGQVLRAAGGVAFGKTLVAADTANRPVSEWSAEGLPDWAVLNASTGRISGTPTGLDGEVYSVIITATGDGGASSETVQVRLDPVLSGEFVAIANLEILVGALLPMSGEFSQFAALDVVVGGADSIFANFVTVVELEAGGSWNLYRDFEAAWQGVLSMDGKFIARDLQRFAWGEFDLAKDFRGEIYLNCYTTSHGRMAPASPVKVGVKLFNNRADSETYREIEGADERPFDLELQAVGGVLNGVVPVTQSRVRAVYNLWATQAPPPEAQVHLSVYLKRQGSGCAAKLEEVADSGWPAGNAREVKYAEWDLCGDLPPRCQPAASGWSPATNAAPYPFMFLQTNASAPGCLPASRLERGNGIDSEDISFARGEIEQEIVIDESHCVTPWSPDPVTICYGAVFTQSTCDCCSEEAGCKTVIRSAVGAKPLVWSEWTPSAATYCPSVSVKQSRYELNGCAEDQSRTVPGTQAGGAWGPWGPLATSVCQGVSFQQSRVDASGCSAPQTQSATGTKQPSWGAWLPLPSDVCSGETFQQTRQDQNGCLAPQTQSATGTKACQCSNSVSDETVYCKGSRFTCCGNGYVHTKRGCVYIGPAGYCGDPANQK
jgi:alpha-tubulin suppressor-like RCC1 family protein